MATWGPEPPARARRHRLRYTDVFYYAWAIFATLAAVGGLFALLVAEWGVALGFFCGALALSAHARLERMEGHTHRGYVEVP